MEKSLIESEAGTLVNIQSADICYYCVTELSPDKNNCRECELGHEYYNFCGRQMWEELKNRQAPEKTP
jgi:predicted amidophosphoribosyltransferase